MPTYQIQVPGKGTYEVSSPTDLTDEQAWAAVRQQIDVVPVKPEEPEEPSTDRTWGEAFTDVGAGLVSGAGALTQLPGQLYGLATGDFSDTGALGLGKDIQEYGESMKSGGLKALEEQRSQRIAEAEEDGQLSAAYTAFKETITDPALLINFLAEQAPQLVVPFGAAKVAKGATLLKAGAGEAATTAAGLAGARAAIGAGAVQQGADVGAGTYEDVYAELKSKGATDEDAATGAINLARAAGASGAIIGLLAQRLPGASKMEEAFAGVPGSGGRLSRGITTGLGEAGGEVVEETGGQFSRNLALREVDPEQALTEGLGQTAGMAAVGGAGMGGITGLATSSRPAQEAQTELAQPMEPDAPTVETDESLFADSTDVADVEDIAGAETDIAEAEADIAEAEAEQFVPGLTEAIEPVSGSLTGATTAGLMGRPSGGDVVGAARTRDRVQAETRLKGLKQEQKAVQSTLFSEDPAINAVRRKEESDRLGGEIAQLESSLKPSIPSTVKPRKPSAEKVPADVTQQQTITEAIQSAEPTTAERIAGLQQEKATIAKTKFSDDPATNQIMSRKRSDEIEAQITELTQPVEEVGTAEPPEFIEATPIEAQEKPEPELVAQLRPEEQRLEREIKSIKKKAGSLWSAVKGRLTPEDVRDISPSKNFKTLQAPAGKVRGTDISTLVSDGALNEYLPMDMRPGAARYDEQESAEFVKSVLRGGKSQGGTEFMPFDAQQDVSILENQLADLQEQIEQELTLDEINAEIQVAFDEQREADREAEASAATAAPRDVAEGATEQAEEPLLTSPTPDDIRERETQREAEVKREAEQAKMAEDKAKADAEVGEFRLTGSDRAADVGASQGQGDLLAAEDRTIGHSINPEEQKVQRELTGKTMLQAADWAVTNATNTLYRVIAEKVRNRIRDLERAGVKLSFNVEGGNRRTAYLRNARGFAQFKWGDKSADGTTEIGITLNGAAVVENQAGYPPGVSFETLLHELIHVATAAQFKFIPTSDPLGQSIIELSNKIVDQFNKDAKSGNLTPIMEKYYKRLNNVLENPDEILAWGLSNKEVAEYYATIKVGETTVFGKLVELARKVLGLGKPYESALDKLISISDSMLGMDVGSIEAALDARGVTFGKRQQTTGVQESLFQKEAPSSIPAGLTGIGYKLIPRGEPRRFKGFGTYEKDGVRVALSGDLLMAERGTVQKYESDGDAMTVEALITDSDSRGQGRARKAMQDVIRFADEIGKDLYLEPVQLEKESGLSRDQLVEFYGSLGFQPTSASGLVMARMAQPVAMSEPAKAPPIDSAAFKKWFGDSKVVDADGNPMVVSHITKKKDITTFDPQYKTELSSMGFHFGTQEQAEFRGGQYDFDSRDGSEIGQYFLSIKNPLRVSHMESFAPDFLAEKMIDMGMIEDAEYSDIQSEVEYESVATGDRLVQILKDKGYDGLVYENEREGAGDSYVPFEPTQIKSATGNIGTFDATSPDIRLQKEGAGESAKKAATAVKEKAKKILQKQPPPEKGLDHISDDFREELGPVFFPQNKTVIDRIESMRDNFWQRLSQGVVDQYRTIRNYSEDAYIKARISKTIDGALEGLMFYGQVFNDGGALNIKSNSKGLLEIMKPLGQEIDSYQMWVALNREARLPEGKRHESLAPLVAKRNQFIQGTINGKPRKEVYEGVLKEMNKLNESVLKVALDSGLIDQKGYDKFRGDIFYIPFYKHRDMEAGDLAGAQTATALTSQQFSKELKGKDDKPFGDLMENTLRNWSHILSASMKNQAAKATLEAAVNLNGATPSLKPGFEWIDGKVFSSQSGEMIEDGELKPWQTQSATGTVKYVQDGNPVHMEVNDPLLLDSIAAIGYMGPKSKFLDMSRDFKNMLQYGVTMSPGFKVRNLIRDSAQSMAVSELNMNPLSNVKEGWQASSTDNPVYQSALAGGAIFNFGAAYEGDQAKMVKRMLERGVREQDILDTPEKIKSGLSAMWRKYEDWGNKSESANRMALYTQMRDDGMTHLEASYAARDLMDFSMQGSWGAVRLATQTVPFLNARLQGLYKLGRDGITPTARVLYNTATGQPIEQTDKQKAASFSIVTGAVGLASAALYMAFKDDEEYKKREDWDRDNFWWFKLPNMEYAIRIPKPFEIGAFGTIVERTLEQMLDEKAEGKAFGEAIQRMLFDTFAIGIMPQIIKPISDIYANKDSFTGSPIESAGMERLSRENRKTASTSPLGVALSNVVNVALPEKLEISPIQADYAVKGYLGWLGGMATSISTYAAMPFSDAAAPDAKIIDNVSLGFVKELPSNQSAYVTRFYKTSKLVNEAMADMRHYASIGEIDKARAIYAEKGDKIKLQKIYTSASKQISEMRKRINQIRVDKKMDGATKKDEIERINQLMSRTAKLAEDARLNFQKAGAGK